MLSTEASSNKSGRGFGALANLLSVEGPRAAFLPTFVGSRTSADLPSSDSSSSSSLLSFVSVTLGLAMALSEVTVCFTCWLVSSISVFDGQHAFEYI